MGTDTPGPKVEIITDPAIFAERVDPVVRREPVRSSVLATNLRVAVRDGAAPGSLWIVVTVGGEVVLGGMIIPPHPLWLTPVTPPTHEDDHRTVPVPVAVPDSVSGTGADSPTGTGFLGDAGPLTGTGSLSDAGPLTGTDSLSDAGPGLTEQVAEELARTLVSATQGPGPLLRGVRGAIGSATPFARAWQRATGRRHEVRMAQRMFELTDLVEPVGVPGRGRLADPSDRDLCIDWMHAFHGEALSGEAPPDVPRIVENRITHGGFTLWTDDGRPVALAGTSTVVAGVARIGPVYTPPHLRRRGYAAAATAAASRAGFEAGASRCMLFTDLANPTSNALYPRLGYRPIGDAIDYTFVD